MTSSNWHPYKIQARDVKISQLLFSNDILLFAKADTIAILAIKNILEIFLNTSDMEINLEKSKL